MRKQPLSPSSSGREVDELFPESWLYSVRFSISSACTVQRREPDQYTETISGEVMNVAENDAEELVGNFTGYRLRCDWAMEEGVSFFDIADAFDQATCDYLLEVFTEDGEVRPEITEIIGDEPVCGPVLMADTLELQPAHRGRGIGHAVVNSFIEVFGPGADLAIARAAPINPPGTSDETMETAKYKRWRARGVKKLRRYWQALGFVSTSPKSEYLVMHLAYKRPTLSQAIQAVRAANKLSRPGAAPRGRRVRSSESDR